MTDDLVPQPCTGELRGVAKNLLNLGYAWASSAVDAAADWIDLATAAPSTPPAPFITQPAWEKIDTLDGPSTPPEPWPPADTPPTDRYLPLEAFVAGAISTLPPFDQHHPGYALPHARQAIEAMGEFDPDDADRSGPSTPQPDDAELPENVMVDKYGRMWALGAFVPWGWLSHRAGQGWLASRDLARTCLYQVQPPAPSTSSPQPADECDDWDNDTRDTSPDYSAPHIDHTGEHVPADPDELER